VVDFVVSFSLFKRSELLIPKGLPKMLGGRFFRKFFFRKMKFNHLRV